MSRVIRLFIRTPRQLHDDDSNADGNESITDFTLSFHFINDNDDYGLCHQNKNNDVTMI